MPMPKRSQAVPDAMLPAYTAVIAQTDAFCRAHLDAECAEQAGRQPHGVDGGGRWFHRGYSPHAP